MALPCVDVASLPELGDEPGDTLGLQEELSAVLDAAFGPEGLGLICVTGGEDFQQRVRQLRADLLPLGFALGKLSPEAQDAIRERGTLNVNNFSRGVDGNRTGFYFHPSLDNPAECLPKDLVPEPTFYAPSLWPEELPELRRRAREACPWLVRTARRLAAAVDARCAQMLPGYRPGTLLRLIGPPESCNHKCRLICYHDFETAEQRAKAKGMWAPPHKDTGLLTALVPSVFQSLDGSEPSPDQEVGLYVRDRKGAITQIKKPDVGECLFFQVGEALQIVSGGLYHATEHCVRGPPAHCRGYERATLAVFLQPHAHEELPLPEGMAMREVAERAYDGLFRMFLLYQPPESRAINFLHFCLRLVSDVGLAAGMVCRFFQFHRTKLVTGPSLSNAAAESVALLSTMMYGDGIQKQYFSHLLDHVQKRKEKFPNRRFYITGHSLGGGLAKLVASKVSMQAVTFMAPGLGTTGYVVFREHRNEELRHSALTIMPENDVVSRVGALNRMDL
ncbi:unnamed protein product [Effrenium voratum]|nr:unnamed protein product [Effrenium voratum]